LTPNRNVNKLKGNFDASIFIQILRRYEQQREIQKKITKNTVYVYKQQLLAAAIPRITRASKIARACTWT